MQEKPLILVTNDDGITAPGIRALIKIMNKIGDVVVVAPDSPQSGMGHAITIDNVLRCNPITIDDGPQLEYTCSGTPAVAPVTSWRFYDTVYTERFLRTPQENPGGYDDNSPVNYAEKLKGNYLLVHGTGDDNVHVQNTYRMINALIEANKQFDMFIVPDRTHGIYKGKNMRLNLYTKMTNFVETHLINNSTKN